MKKSKKGFMFEMLGMLLAVMLWCVPMEVSAEGEYKLPFHTTYDITEKVFNIELTLETEEDVYLAYYSGSEYREAAFEEAIFTGGKSAVISGGRYQFEPDIWFWVVDENKNLIAEVYPELGDEVFKESNAFQELYGSNNSRFYYDEEFSKTVEFINGNDLGTHDFNCQHENGRLTISLPDLDVRGNIYVVSFNGTYSNSRGTMGYLDGTNWTINISDVIEDSGEYTFAIYVEGEAIRSKNQYIYYDYSKPNQKVGNALKVEAVAEKAGVFTFTLPETPIDITAVEIVLQYEYEEDNFWSMAYTTIENADLRCDNIGGNKYKVDINHWINEEDNYVYRYGVRVYSSDIENYAHSDWVYSDVYDPSAVKTPEEQVRAFVERMYTVALGRESDPSGIDYWANQLLTHQADGASLSEGFILSDEFEEKNYSNAEYLEVLYKTFFNREADEGGIAHWTSQMESGKSRRSVLAGFVNSNEFDELCTSYGIDRGTMSEDEPSGEVPAEGGVEQFVERLYTVCLERASEPAGLAEWTRRINAGESTPEEVAKFFFMSDEYVEKNTSNEKYIETLYLTFMDRTAEAGGKAYWVEQLNQGVSREVALSGFAQSPEFQEIMDRYGL